MEERSSFHPLDYLSVFQRRKWWLITPVLVALVAGACGRITACDLAQHVVAPRVPPAACLLAHNQGGQGLDGAAPRPPE